VYIWATERSQRHPDRPAWPLIAWLVAALVMFHLLLDLFYWRRLSVWTVHFAIRCAALVGILVLAIRERKREAEEIISSHR
jgi:hypothetical protein